MGVLDGLPAFPIELLGFDTGHQFTRLGPHVCVGTISFEDIFQKFLAFFDIAFDIKGLHRKKIVGQRVFGIPIQNQAEILFGFLKATHGLSRRGSSQSRSKT
jgi:hypothetical protein